MSRTSWKCLLVGVVAALAISMAAPQADACGGRWCGYGWGGCYGGCGAACYTGCSPCYGLGGCCGSYLTSDWYLCAAVPLRGRALQMVWRLWLRLGLAWLLWLRLRLWLWLRRELWLRWRLQPLLR